MASRPPLHSTGIVHACAKDAIDVHEGRTSRAYYETSKKYGGLRTCLRLSKDLTRAELDCLANGTLQPVLQLRRVEYASRDSVSQQEWAQAADAISAGLRVPSMSLGTRLTTLASIGIDPKVAKALGSALFMVVNRLEEELLVEAAGGRQSMEIDPATLLHWCPVFALSRLRIKGLDGVPAQEPMRSSSALAWAVMRVLVADGLSVTATSLGNEGEVSSLCIRW